MATTSALRISAILAVGLLAATSAAAFSINKSIKISAGAQSDGDSTVNGSITVGSNAVINGSLETVNGTIRVEDGVTVRELMTVNGSIRVGSGLQAADVSSVNGSIRIGENATIDGEVSVVNGKIALSPGTRVAEDVSNVNGELSLTGTEIGGDVTTVTGDVELTENAVLRGDLVVEKPGGSGWWGRDRRKPRVVIGPGTRVLGEIRAEHEIELYISNSAEVAAVTGEASLEDAIRFSGRRP